MIDAERVLGVLLHDLRTPLGVALGYLRMLNRGTLTGEDDRTKALMKTQDALARLSRLCDEASALSAEPSSTVAGRARADALLQELAAIAPASGLIVDQAASVSGSIDAAGDLQGLATAMVHLFRSAAPAGSRVSVSHSADALRLVAASDPSTAELPQQPFDPWSRGGLTTPLAWRTIHLARGQVTITPSRSALAIVLPLQSQDSTNS